MLETTLKMENEEKSVDDIKKEIKDLENDIEKIQSECSHKFKIKFDVEKKAVFRICEDCGKNLGYATSEELKKNGFTK